MPAAKPRVTHYGSKQPVGEDKDEGQRKMSRRVEFHVTRYSGMEVGPRAKGAPAVTPVPASIPAPAPTPTPAPAPPATP